MSKDFVLSLYVHRITKEFLMELAEILWENKGEEKVVLKLTNRYGVTEKILELKSMKIDPNIEMYLKIMEILEPYRFRK
tara:strand:- start:189 stop:425 length:237 start_codon:yes stop_codon:yes gene_type:complete